MKKITFREYFESIQILRKAVNDVPKRTANYSLTKYCKLPILETVDSSNKDYISLKPKDTITVTWEYNNKELPTPISVKIVTENAEQIIYPAWSNLKFFKWVTSSTNELELLPK